MNGAAAVNFAKTHSSPAANAPSVQKGLSVGLINSTNWASTLTYNIKIPSAVPSGKNLRVLLTWDSNPSLSSDINELSDLDLRVTGASTVYISNSFDGNVEVVDIPGSQVAPNSTLAASIQKYLNRIPASGTAGYFYYAVAWDWVDDHAP